jgi:hypothetical protein
VRLGGCDLDECADAATSIKVLDDADVPVGADAERQRGVRAPARQRRGVAQQPAVDALRARRGPGARRQLLDEQRRPKR